MKDQKRLAAVLLALALALAGCGGKPAEEESGSASSGSSGGTGRTAKSAPPAPVTITIPAGTDIDVRLNERLSSKTSTDGQTFSASVDAPVLVDGKEAIPKGAEVTGRVTKAVPSGRLKQRAELWVALASVQVRGKTYNLATSTTGHKEGSKTNRNILFIGGGGGGGAAIGAIAGGGKGAGIGAAIGAGAGLAGAMMTGKKDIQFPAETKLRFSLQQPVQVQQ